MTFAEYQYRMKAYRLARVDAEYDMHLSAWLHQQAGATKDQGEKKVPLYKKFSEFFDYEARLRDIEPVSSSLSDRQRQMAKMAARVNQ